MYDGTFWFGAMLPSGARHALDSRQQPTILFSEPWSLNYFAKQNPKIVLSDVPFGTR